jgi:hypothetical protein
VALIKSLAIVGIGAQPYFIAATEANLLEPVRIGKRLPGESDDVGLALSERGFGLRKVVYATGDHNWRGQAMLPQAGTHFGRWRKIAPKGSLGIRVLGGHALITALTGVRVGRFSHFGLACILELAATR